MSPPSAGAPPLAVALRKPGLCLRCYICKGSCGDLRLLGQLGIRLFSGIRMAIISQKLGCHTYDTL